MKNWTFRGTALDDFGVVTLLDDVFDAPERRGENLKIPHRHGRIHTRKYYDQRTLLLGITIRGDTISDVENYFFQLKALCAQTGEGALSVEKEDGTVLNANAEVSGSIQPSVAGPVAVKTTIPFVLSDPFFYAESATVQTVTINASPTSATVANGTVADGNVEVDTIEIVLTGPLNNTQISNTTNDVSLTYGAAIAAGQTVTISVDAASGEYKAVHSVSGNVIGNVTHSGSPALMVFDPGDNAIEITDSVATTGTVKFTFTPRYV